MSYISLDTAKRHLNIDADYTEDDTYISSLIEVAELVVAKDICSELNVLEEAGKIPAPLTHAALLLVGNYYANREPVAFAAAMQVPLTYEHLVSKYRNYEQ